MAEALDEGPGSDVVMARLSAAIVTRALREDIKGASDPGWVRDQRPLHREGPRRHP